MIFQDLVDGHKFSMPSSLHGVTVLTQIVCGDVHDITLRWSYIRT